MATPPRIGFLFIGGAHQVLHTAPVAAELAKLGCTITAFIASEGERAIFERVWRAYGSPQVIVQLMPTPGWARLIGTLVARWATMKIPRLIASRDALADMDAVVTPEYTSTFLKRLPGRRPTLIHFPHGSGDRARSVDKRLSFYDLVLVAGEKTRDRMISEGVVLPDRIRIAGSPKLAVTERLARNILPLFADRRPTVFYNPHFDVRIGSWSHFGKAVIDAVSGSESYNLVVAPHVRLFQHSTALERERIQALQKPGQVHIDLGSAACSDMTYIGQSDIYLGDVSSQVNEFVTRPRPCVFLNAHGVNWKDDPSYLFWKMGEVVDDIADLIPALRRAPALFYSQYRDEQVAMTEQTFGHDLALAPCRSATIILNFLQKPKNYDAPVVGKEA